MKFSKKKVIRAINKIMVDDINTTHTCVAAKLNDLNLVTETGIEWRRDNVRRFMDKNEMDYISFTEMREKQVREKGVALIRRALARGIVPEDRIFWAHQTIDNLLA